MLMTYLYDSFYGTTKVRQGSAVVVESPGKGPDGDLNPLASTQNELKDETDNSVTAIRLQAASVGVHGNPNKESAQQLIGTPIPPSMQSSKLPLPVIVERPEERMLPASQSAPETKSKNDLADAITEAGRVSKKPADTAQDHEEPVSDSLEEDADVLKLWVRVRDLILMDESSTAGPSTEIPATSPSFSPRPSSAPRTTPLSTTFSFPITPSDAAAVDIVRPGQIRSYFSSPILCNSPERGRFVESFDLERASVFPDEENECRRLEFNKESVNSRSAIVCSDVPRIRDRKRSISGLLSRWRRDKKSRQ